MTRGSECGSTHEKNLCLQMRKSHRRQEASVFGSTSVRRVISPTCGLGPLRSEVRVPGGLAQRASISCCWRALGSFPQSCLRGMQHGSLTNLGQPGGEFGPKKTWREL